MTRHDPAWRTGAQRRPPRLGWVSTARMSGFGEHRSHPPRVFPQPARCPEKQGGTRVNEIRGESDCLH